MQGRYFSELLDFGFSVKVFLRINTSPISVLAPMGARALSVYSDSICLEKSHCYVGTLRNRR